MYMWIFVLEIVGSISDLQGHTGEKNVKEWKVEQTLIKQVAEQVASSVVAYIIKDQRYAAGGWYQPVDNSEQVSILKSVVFFSCRPLDFSCTQN